VPPIRQVSDREHIESGASKKYPFRAARKSVSRFSCSECGSRCVGTGFFDLNRRYESFDEKKESPLDHAVCRPWSRRRRCRHQNFVALSRGAGQGGRGTRVISRGRALVPSSFRPEGKKKSAKGASQVPPREARWTKKHERSYLNHIGVDRRRKFMRRYGARGCEPTI
jgi:hypothetical protein